MLQSSRYGLVNAHLMSLRFCIGPSMHAFGAWWSSNAPAINREHAKRSTGASPIDARWVGEQAYRREPKLIRKAVMLPMPPQISIRNGGLPPEVSCGYFDATAELVRLTRDWNVSQLAGPIAKATRNAKAEERM